MEQQRWAVHGVAQGCGAAASGRARLPSAPEPGQAAGLRGEAQPELLRRHGQHVLKPRLGVAPGAAPELACAPIRNTNVSDLVR